MEPEETTIGLHDVLMETVLPRYARAGARAIDLGARSGALAARLKGMGLEVTAVSEQVAREKRLLNFLPVLARAMLAAGLPASSPRPGLPVAGPLFHAQSLGPAARAGCRACAGPGLALGSGPRGKRHAKRQHR